MSDTTSAAPLEVVAPTAASGGASSSAQPAPSSRKRPLIPEGLQPVSAEENKAAMIGGPRDNSWKTLNGDEVTIKNVRLNGLWSLNIGANDTCAICRDALQGLCIQCQTAAEEKPNCRVAQLPCGHAFHYHCVSAWLQSRNQHVCPTCQAVVHSSEDIQFHT